MKIEQKSEFVPVVITLETSEEMRAFWDLINVNRHDWDTETRHFSVIMTTMINNTIHL